MLNAENRIGVAVKSLPKEEVELAAVVVIVRVTGIDVVEDVKLTLAGLKLQAVSAGKFEHIAGESMVEPVKPDCAVKVKIVDPD